MQREAWKLILPYVKELANGNLLYDNLEGWDGQGHGREVWEGINLWLNLVDVRQKTTKFYKANTLQLKKNKVGKKKQFMGS